MSPTDDILLAVATTLVPDTQLAWGGVDSLLISMILSITLHVDFFYLFIRFFGFIQIYIHESTLGYSFNVYYLTNIEYFSIIWKEMFLWKKKIPKYESMDKWLCGKSTFSGQQSKSSSVSIQSIYHLIVEYSHVGIK